MTFLRAMLAICTGPPWVGRVFLVAVLVAGLWGAATVGPLPTAGSRRTQAQAPGELTWAKLLDNKPHYIAFSPDFATDRLALFGTSNKDLQHGIWRSTDGGDTWVKSSEGIPDAKQIDVYEIVFSPDFTTDRTVFASVNKQRVALGEPAGALFRSTDGGQTWQEVPLSGFPLRSGRPAQDMVSLALSPAFARDRTLFSAVAGLGVFRSTDGGTTWERILGQPINVVRVAPTYPQEPLLMVATDAAGILASTDGGTSWTPRNVGLEGVRNFKQLLFSADFARDRTLLTMSTTEGLFISRDGGASWRNLVRPPRGDQMLATAAPPTFVSEGHLAYGLRTGEVALSHDLGQNWTSTGSASLLGQIEGLFMPPDYASSRTLWAVSVFNGLFRYYPVESGSAVALTVTAVAVRATATAEALPAAIARQQEVRQETLRETGCITYSLPPVLLLLGWALRRRARGRWKEKSNDHPNIRTGGTRPPDF